MPFYEYQCNACGHRLEVLQKISDEPLRYCPECGEADLKKLISKSAFRLKGGGWYETDFKHGDAKDAKGRKADAGKASKSTDRDGAAPSDGKKGGKKDGASKEKSPSSAGQMKKSA